MAISKTHIHCTTTVVSPSPMVNIGRCTSIDAVDVPVVTGVNSGNLPKYEIHFTMAQDPKTGRADIIKWAFAAAATRDTEIGKIRTLISEVTV